MISFDVLATRGWGTYWMRCRTCLYQATANTEDDAIALGFAHADELHPGEEVNPDGVRVSSSIASEVVITDPDSPEPVPTYEVITCTECRIEIWRGKPEYPGNPVALTLVAEHLDAEHPWQVRANPRGRARPEAPGKPDGSPGRP